MTIPVLRRAYGDRALAQVWPRVHAAREESDRRCPACAQAMVRVALAAPVSPGASTSDGPRIEACRTCHLLWFDAGEIEAPRAAATARAGPLATVPPNHRVRAGRAIAEAAAKTEQDAPGRLPDEDWKLVAALLGLPVEHDRTCDPRPAWLTWGLAGACAVVAVVSWLGGGALADALAFDPDDPLRRGGLGFVTSAFVHGGWLHLLGNLWFLLVLGDDVELDLGRWRHLLLLAGAQACALVGVMWAAPGVPVVGASGALAGVVAYYALRFRTRRIGVLLRWPITWQGTWLNLPASAYALFWVLLQVLGYVFAVAGYERATPAGHLGGAVAGLLAWVLVDGRSGTREAVGR